MGEEARAPYPFRTHQRQALDAIEKAEADGVRRAWVVLPPGAGKTLVGLETARRRGRTTVVLGPNTAIQTQWLRGWDAFGAEPATSTREVDGFLTALTYQSLATFDDRDELDGPGEGSLLDGLHPNGRALVARLKEIGDLTLVLDECHHLLEVWGRLVAELLEELPDAFVLGLTATPPGTLTRDQKRLVDELFGDALVSVSIPAVVREGDLAPFAELAWLTVPTPTEQEWLAAQGERFAELTTALSDPAYGSTGFFAWLDHRFVQQALSWSSRAASEPELTDAALRMVHAGLLATPEGARLRERHRHQPTADDWVLLLEGWVLQLRGTGLDEGIVRRIRAVLPSVGYQLTTRGIRRGRSPVDRVLARSESKAVALEQVAQAEHRALGDRLRLLVLCDHERASATVPADLEGVLDQQAGSATLALEHLQQTVPDLHPLLVTGTTVAGSTETLTHLRSYVGDGSLQIVDGRLEGGWTSRDWVPWVTRFFEEGHCQVLVGTRGLLGEGWDARAVTGLVDLTTATTSTSVVQTRGRALRIDAGWPEKVALTWSVVCVSDQHPKGNNDWDRFVRRHDGFYGVDGDGDVVAGVAHVDASFSPYAPPPTASFDAVNAAMLVRLEQRALIRDAWAVGAPYEDTLVPTLRVSARRTVPISKHVPRARPEPASVVLHDGLLDVRDRRPTPWRPPPGVVAVAVLLVIGYLVDLTPAPVVLLGLAVLLAVQTAIAVRRGQRLADELARPPSIERVAFAVADALREAGLASLGSEAVRVVVDEHGDSRCALEGVTSDVAAGFATALDEVLSPMVAPRYVVPRWLLLGPVQHADAVRGAFGRLRADAEVWHSVPATLATTGERAQVFARCWDRWVGGGAAVYTGSPQGEGVLVTHRGSDPFDVTTVLRLHWR